MRGGTECLVPGPLSYIGIMGIYITEQCTVLLNTTIALPDWVEVQVR